MRLRLRAVVVGALLAMGITAVGAADIRPAAAALAPPTFFTPLDKPLRLYDSRPTGPLGPNGVVEVQVTGAAPLPAPGTVAAVVLNVTVTGPANPGFWTVWPARTARPFVSNLNVDLYGAGLGPALAVPNLVTVPVGPTGAVGIFSEAGGNVVVDVLGYYQPTTSAVSAGRFEPLATPRRVLDTRNTGNAFAAMETRTVAIPGASGASAVALNMTGIHVLPGFWRVYAAGGPVPDTSNLNASTGLEVTANQVIVPVNPSGEVTVFSSGGGHLILDLVGTFTGAGAPASTAGLFVPLDRPTRLADTRDPAANPLGGTRMLLPTWSTEIPVSNHPAVNRNDVAAVVVNLTVTEALAGGYVSATTAGANRPENRYRSTSTLNAQRAGQTLANHAIVPVSARGVDVFAERGGHVVADTAGFFQGTPAPAPFGGPANSDPTPLFCEGFPAQPVSAVGRGSSPGEVVKVQVRLRQLSFWNFAVDGSYGLTTSQAVMAFQKWKGLPATARVDEATAVALNTTVCRPTAGQGGDLLEVNKARQIAHVVRDGRVVWTFNVSTGNGQSYDEEDQRNAGRRAIGIAITPTGTFRTYREYDVPRYEGTLGTLYRPKFVVGGIAVHGASNVPNYPASHGCIRVVNPVMDLIWRDNLLPLRSTVWIHD